VAVAIAILGSLAVPGTALAQFLPVQEEPSPGITMSGNGLARVAAPGRLSEESLRRAIRAAQPAAASRALRDARRRAAAVAAAARVRLGRVAAVQFQDELQQFGQPSHGCRAPRRGEAPRCRAPAFTAAVATVTFSITGGAEGTEDGVEVEAYGAASAPVEPGNRRSSRSIRQALAAARVAVTPDAAAAARRGATTAARSAGLTLGAVVSIAEQQQPYPYFYDAALGSFGPGVFCGLRRVHRRVRERRCSFPRTYSLRLVATYAAQSS
jgi:hypothetical protein